MTSESKVIFSKCGICGEDVEKKEHVGIRLDDDDFKETWQWYHPTCYGSVFSNIPRRTGELVTQ